MEIVAVEQWPLPALLRRARSVVASAVREALDEAGFDDLPANGPFVLGGILRTAAPLSEVIQGLALSKQAAGQLVDALVTRGYLERSIDPDDRRRLLVHLTERGEEAATIIREVVDSLERCFAAAFGAERFAIAREVLAGIATFEAPIA